MAAIDSFIPEPKRDIDKPFLMPVETCSAYRAAGLLLRVAWTGESLKLARPWRSWGFGPRKRRFARVLEMFRKLLDEGRAGDNIGVLLRGTKREEVERGQVVAHPGTITPHTKFKAEVYILSKEEGGRHTPFFNGYRPQFYFRTTDVTGILTLPEGIEMVMPGDNVAITADLITPIAMEKRASVCDS